LHIFQYIIIQNFTNLHIWNGAGLIFTSEVCTAHMMIEKRFLVAACSYWVPRNWL